MRLSTRFITSVGMAIEGNSSLTSAAVMVWR
jgi:hypothetical protein